MSEIFKPNSDKNEQELKKEAVHNVYDKEKFSPETAKDHVESLVTDFKDYYSLLGYREEPSVQISSGIDSTVRFIGSHISVFKPYLGENNVPAPGIFMRQNCLRTRNADKLLDDEYFPNWGSYFPSIGAITPPERLDEACDETFGFFEKRLAISRENLLIRINSADTDLIDTCKQRYEGDNLEIDSRKPEYYRHNIGMEGVRGRNFNIALRNPNGEGFADIGNIILLEDAQKQLGVEIALGSTTILKQLYGLDHVQDCTPVIGLNVENETIRRKFEDAIITSTVLCREGLRPFGQNNRNRILKQYVRSLSYFRAKSRIDIETLSQIVANFEKREFPESTDQVASVVMEFLKAFENELLVKKNLTDDDKKIKESLELLT
ncbi:MAG: hypothetical protein A3B03_00590 [Candidatus Zambryskibacteria bacterium RIFCSPLOWO2_01_FULL_42_41]|nr:MAG: hypothetical protein A2829_01135 [Candidatus Zambryskibacteria bacterium RIFCSPHIGHO2_01_FULL_43_60]OHB03511.1 MAG: hypothetical protein A3B03_00590 [Candidatus Zambryskibacteria bacterium RIFCSPLOWO2_01_FULL_42_41]